MDNVENTGRKTGRTTILRNNHDLIYTKLLKGHPFRKSFNRKRKDLLARFEGPRTHMNDGKTAQPIFIIGQHTPLASNIQSPKFREPVTTCVHANQFRLGWDFVDFVDERTSFGPALLRRCRICAPRNPPVLIVGKGVRVRGGVGCLLRVDRCIKIFRRKPLAGLDLKLHFEECVSIPSN